MCTERMLRSLAIATCFLMVLLFMSPPGQASAASVQGDAGCRSFELAPNDDGSSSSVTLPFEVAFYGARYSSLWVNNNGNVTFDAPLATYVPFDLSSTNRVIIAPFFADVDTRGLNSGRVSYGETTFGGQRAFCVLWDSVGYYSRQSDRLNSFQLLLVEKSSGFDVVFRYQQIQWEMGSASSGVPARAGFSNGDPNRSVQLTGSAVSGAFLDGGAQALASRSVGSSTPGEFIFQVRNGCTRNDPLNIPIPFSCDSNWWDWPDNDMDGLPDHWETNGVYVRGERLDLAAAGARVGVRDAFIYVDVVEGERWNDRIEQLLVRSFAAGPIDGSGGIALHIKRARGNLTRGQVPDSVQATRGFFETVTAATPTGGTAFASTAWSQSTSTPQLAKYILVGPDHAEGSGTGGQAIGFIADHLVVTMNESRWLSDIVAETGLLVGSLIRLDMILPSFRDLVHDSLNAITTMHELGHLYGLKHHGSTSAPEYDLNYKSIMSYSYNAFGVPRGEGLSKTWHLDYSRSSDVNLDWRMSTTSGSPEYGALTLIHGQNGERGDFYTNVDSFPDPEEFIDEPCAPIEELLNVPGVVENGAQFLGSLDTVGPQITWGGGIDDGAVFEVGSVPTAPECTAADDGSGVNSDGCAVTGYDTGIGDHTLTATAKDQLGNVTSESRRYSVTAAPVQVTVTAEDKSTSANSPLPTFTFTTTGLPEGVSLTSAPSCGVGAADSVGSPGTYDITCTGGTAPAGFSISNYVNGKLTVNPPAVTANDALYIGSSSSGKVGFGFSDEDILLLDTTTDSWSMFFDGSDVGLAREDVDAFDRQSDGSLLMSFTTDVDLPGVGEVDDSDIVRFVPTSTGDRTAGTWQWYFDGSDVGLTTAGEDVDAFTVLSDGHLVLSTTGSIKAPGMTGRDEDLLEFTPTQLGEDTQGIWAKYFDGSRVGLTKSGEDVNGVDITEDGQIYLTTVGKFKVGGVAGDSSDIFVCRPAALGNHTRCAFSLFWDGSRQGFRGEDADSFLLARR